MAAPERDGDGDDDDDDNKDFVIENGFPALNNFHRRRRRRLQQEAKDADNTDADADPLPRFPFASYSDAMSFPSSSKSASSAADDSASTTLSTSASALSSARPFALVGTGTPPPSFLQDCETVFTARTREEDASFSSGSTFFLPCHMKPRCGLEALARQIFRFHVAGLNDCDDIDGDGKGAVDGKGRPKNRCYDPERSGAEWWTLVLDAPTGNGGEDGTASDDGGRRVDVYEKDNGVTAKDCDEDGEDEDEDDEVGLHFDADYGLEDQAPNFFVHPRLATITYLSDVGVPTLILNKRPPPPAEFETKDALEQSLGGNVGCGWLSHPRVGKHVAFDGRLLHGAPGMYFPACGRGGRLSEEATDGDKEPDSKRRRFDDTATKVTIILPPPPLGMKKRVTFMVNVWLNHCPIDAEVLDGELLEKLSTVWEDDDEKTGAENGANLKRDEDYRPPFTWNLGDALSNKDLIGTASLAASVSASSENASEQAGAGALSAAAGTEEVVLCRRNVVVSFGASMKDCHDISRIAAMVDDQTGKGEGGGGGSLQLDLKEGALHLTVGEEVASSDDDDDDDDEEDANN